MRPWFYFSPAQPLWLIHAGPLLGNTSWSLSCILSYSQFQNWTWNHNEIEANIYYCVVWQNWPEFSITKKTKIWPLKLQFTLFTVSKIYFLFPIWFRENICLNKNIWMRENICKCWWCIIVICSVSTNLQDWNVTMSGLWLVRV